MIVVSGCATQEQTGSGPFKPYRFAIQQGNYVTADAIKQLREGMTREQVRNVLGSPLAGEVFRADRWDYFFHYIQPNGKRETRRAVVFFKGDKLAKVEASELPASEAADDPVLSRGRKS